jgi:glucoamylase
VHQDRLAGLHRGHVQAGPAFQRHSRSCSRGAPLGRAWPLLTAERGEYAVTAGASGMRYLRAVARATGSSDLLAEQVWDGRPPTGRSCCRLGEGTRPATPLIWSHAALIRLAWTIQRGVPVDQQAVVAIRYTP